MNKNILSPKANYRSKEKTFPHINQLKTLVLSELDTKFDIIYFNLVKYLMENVSKIHSRGLNSINSFCQKK
jgi:hypothetical protein